MSGYRGSSNRPYRGRGGGGRGRGGRGGAPSTPRPPPVPARDITEGLRLDRPIQTLTPPTTVTGFTADVTNVQYIGSYNWLDREGSQRTILVPGSPPEWLDRRTPYVVKEDTSECFVDQNGFRIPASPLLPLIASVDFHHANEARSFDWSSVDIITDRNGLRKLLRWVRGEVDRDFRIDLQLAGKKTILFTRWEKHTKEHPMFTGTFGHNFEEASTKPTKGCEGSTGHHRVVQKPVPSSPKSPSQNSKPPQSKKLNTGRVKWDEIVLQMSIAQTPHLFLGVHDRGNFEQVHKKSAASSPELKAAEAEVKPALLKLRRVLEDIKRLVVVNSGRLSLICRDGKLDVVERISRESCLPGEFLNKFDE
ncbi:hypothetical protein PQX77_006064 [Marasmius sp. AFHP31]|nr:hypothetical protein PQX77_006064 [Marasmius sp. AFHP31]